MQLANIMLALAGDPGQVIPKFNVTPSEVAVLRVIHGSDAVNDITIVGDVNRTHRTEHERLTLTYGRGINGEIRSPAVDRLFPGAAAKLFDTFDELGGVEEAEMEEDEVITPVAAPVKNKGGRPRKHPVIEAAPEEAPADHFE